jgi:hypothetical protein
VTNAKKTVPFGGRLLKVFGDNLVTSQLFPLFIQRPLANHPHNRPTLGAFERLDLIFPRQPFPVDDLSFNSAWGTQLALSFFHPCDSAF